MSSDISKASAKSADKIVAVVNVDETKARELIKSINGEVVRLFCLELDSGWIWLRIDPDMIEFLCSMSKTNENATSVKSHSGTTSNAPILDLVADPVHLQTFFVDDSPVIYWRHSWSSEVDRTGWKALSTWLKEQVNPLRK